MELNILLRLLCAHLLCDFLLQPSSLVKKKVNGTTSERTIYNLIHASVQAAAAYVVVAEWGAWYIPVAVFASHFAIDFWYKGGKKDLRTFLVDQLLHIAVIVVLWLFVTDQFGSMRDWAQDLLVCNNLWIVLIAYAIVLQPASIFISTLIQRWSKQLDDKNNPLRLQEKGLKEAGLWIGYIERFLIVTFIFMGAIEPIGFLLAAKSIFRYGDLKDLKDIKMTEYVLIGTLLSFSTAIVIAMLFKLCLQ